VDKSWGEFCRLSDLPAFKGLREDISENVADWKALYDSDLPHRERLPRHWWVTRASHGVYWYTATKSRS